ncbi:MAG TPA: peptidyl-dipeptidase Dcp [Vicinamibacterales bacterium]|jgi:peptidyl-dipeptidase Dcp
MQSTRRLLVTAVLAGTSLCLIHGQERANPLLSKSTLPFHAPQFDQIKDADFLPALEAGIKEERAEIQKIAGNAAPPTFDNTIDALERTGQMLTRVQMIFNGLTGANTNDALQKTQEEVAPKLASLQSEIFLNAKLFNRVEAIYGRRAALKLSPEALRLVEWYHEHFILAGAKLGEADKAVLAKLTQEDATLGTKFTNQLLAAAKAGAVVLDTPAALAGLSQAEIDGAAQAAKERGLDGKWLITLQNTTQQPPLLSLDNRDTRRRLFEASWTRAEHGDANDTRAAISRLAQLRAQQAALVGFPNFAAWKLQDQMAKTPAAVDEFLGKLAPAATARARREAVDLQALVDSQHGGFQVEAYDWDHYAEQVRKATFDLDESQIKPYFELNRVLTDGVFFAANKLYGLTFKERTDLPVYEKDVRVFEVNDASGAPLALFYADYFKRDNKNGGAWMDNFVGQSKLLETRPVIYNVANFDKPAAGAPALLTADDVVTMFHEFGHALHGFFADQRYPTLSGTSVARDFVEFPSQFNEHWALNPEVLAHYAVHYKTGEKMPKALVEKILAARDFNAGYNMTELISAALLDMEWHSLDPKAPLQDVDAFEKTALARTHVDLPQVPPRYRSSYFLHIWGNGYAAGYYAYLWTQMLADDCAAWFDAHGGLTRANGDRFRRLVLSRGNTLDLGVMFRDFAGHDPQIEPMIKNRGLAAR